MPIARRALLGAGIAATALSASASETASVRIGVLRYGTVSWEVDVMRHHALDSAAHVEVVLLKIALGVTTEVLNSAQPPQVVPPKATTVPSGRNTCGPSSKVAPAPQSAKIDGGVPALVQAPVTGE